MAAGGMSMERNIKEDGLPLTLLVSLKTHVTGRKHMVSSAGLIMMREKHFKTYILLVRVHVRDSQLAVTSTA